MKLKILIFVQVCSGLLFGKIEDMDCLSEIVHSNKKVDEMSDLQKLEILVEKMNDNELDDFLKPENLEFILKNKKIDYLLEAESIKQKKSETNKYDYAKKELLGRSFDQVIKNIESEIKGLQKTINDNKTKNNLQKSPNMQEMWIGDLIDEYQSSGKKPSFAKNRKDCEYFNRVLKSGAFLSFSRGVSHSFREFNLNDDQTFNFLFDLFFQKNKDGIFEQIPNVSLNIKIDVSESQNFKLFLQKLTFKLINNSKSEQPENYIRYNLWIDGFVTTFDDFIKSIKDKIVFITNNKTQIADSGIEFIAKEVKNLKGFAMLIPSYIKPETINLEPFAKCKKITFFRVSNLNIEDKNLNIIKKFKNLRNLEVSNCKLINGDFLQNLRSPELLKEINLEHTNLGNKGLKHLDNCLNLRNLCLNNCPKVGNKGLITFKNFQKLKRVNFSHCDQITLDGLYNLKSSDAIIILQLSNLSSLKSDSLKFIGNVFKKLRALDLRGIKNFTDSDFKYLSNLKNLESIRFSDSIGITGEGLKYLHDDLNEKFKGLTLANCNVSNDSIKNNLPRFKALKHLTFDDCKLIDNSSLKIFEKMSNLETLSIKNTNVTKEGILKSKLTIGAKIDIEFHENLSY